MRRRIPKYFFFVVSFFLLARLFAQVSVNGFKSIEQAIEQKKYAEARVMLENDVSYFLSENNIDTLLAYIYPKGQVTAGLYGNEKATAAVFSFADLLKSKNASPSQMVGAYKEIARVCDSLGEYGDCFKASELRLMNAEKISPVSQQEVALSHFMLGTYAFKIGKRSLFNAHQRIAYHLRVTDNKTRLLDLYLSANAMGRAMSYLSKNDSAYFFYQEALSFLERMPESDTNKYYRPAVIYQNISVLNSTDGRSAEAIRNSYKAIDLYRKYIATPQSYAEIQDVKGSLYGAIDNLANYYMQVGDLNKAEDLFHYSYGHKKKDLNPTNPRIFISEVLLGRLYINNTDYHQAKHYLKMGLDRIRNSEETISFWAADAWSDLGIASYETESIQSAKDCFEKADSLYELSYQGAYDIDYVHFSRDATLFLAKNGEYDKALRKAKQVYRYLQSIGEGESMEGFYQITHIAKLNLLSKRYEDAFLYSNLALQAGSAKVQVGSSPLDSINVNVFTSEAMLVRAKSSYGLHTGKDSAFLQKLYTYLEGALQMVEKQKVFIDDPENISMLIESNKELIDFTATLALELFRKTNSPNWLEQFINLKESGLYSRIRSRLDKASAVRFAQLPADVLQEENRLKEAMRNALSGTGPHADAISEYRQTVAKWEAHLRKVAREYPAYYKLRYATLFRSVPELQATLPANTTLVRYYFVDTSLVALVADRKNKKLVTFDTAGLKENISMFLRHTAGEKEQLAMLHQLYLQVWAPLAPFVTSEKVIVVPDGALYNFSFDMLPFEPVTQYRQLYTKSLLAKHTFSYHYSLFVLGNEREQNRFNENYVAFAPGFSDELKRDYAGKVKDSLHLDQSYLTMLPQPNTNVLARKIKETIGGDLYLGRSSTQRSFRENAGGHKLIHIATHAEYNNASPERSGLIFAKTNPLDDSNRLYLTDIYNCELSSDVTILTACESGRPGYQDGEGMVSLAHAFNYAGSGNILTALWKIDERSSSQITESFIGFIKAGMQTDEALRRAKLDYLRNSEGRLVDPGYWAGLVLMGVPLTIEFAPQPPDRLPMVGTAIVCLAACGFFLVRRRSVSRAA